MSLVRHEREHGAWITWKDFKKDVQMKYISTNSTFARYLKLKWIVQKDGESVEFYYQYFDESIDRQKMDSTPVTGDDIAEETAGSKKGNDLHNFMFVDNLHSTIKPGFLRLPEARDFHKRELYEIRELAIRVEESVSHFKEFIDIKGSSSNSNSGSKSSTKKFQKSRDTDEISREKLISKEKNFLNSNVQRRGGIYIYPNVQKKFEWIKWARKDKLCMKCAAKHHIEENCMIKDIATGSDSRKGGKDSLHAMITAMEAEEARSEMYSDG